MTMIYFVRHAQSDRDAHDERTRPLTETGLRDSQMLADALSDKQLDFIVSSPYKRCIDTVTPLAARLGKKIVTDEDLRERNAGAWHGDRFFDFIKDQWEDHSHKLEGGESLAEVQARNISAIERILDSHDGENGIIATHGTALSTILCYYYPEYDFECFLKIADLMPFVIRLDLEDHKCISAQVEFAVRRIYK